jgi:hypothetical protein
MDATELDGSTGLRTGDASHDRLVLWVASPAEGDGLARAAGALRCAGDNALVDGDHGQAEAVGWMADEAESNRLIVLKTVVGPRV